MIHTPGTLGNSICMVYVRFENSPVRWCAGKATWKAGAGVRRPESVGKEPRQEWPHDHKARTDNANVYLYSRP